MKPMTPRWSGPACPEHPKHGPLLDFVTDSGASWFCPAAGHKGPQFYDGTLNPVPRAGQEAPSTAPAQTPASDPDAALRGRRA